MRRGMTYVDLVVVLVVTPMVLMGLMACMSGGRSIETANRVKCASNLRQIGQGLLLYANENKGHYPRTIYAPGLDPVSGTGAGAKDPFVEGAVAPNDVTAAMFLLLRTQDLTQNAFLCPSSVQERDFVSDEVIRGRSNWQNIKTNLSYSFQNPYPREGVVDVKTYWTNNMNPEMALAADRNPGKVAGAVTLNSPHAQIKTLNSRNHDQDGQNVLYADGHAEFQNTPFCGIQRDNIYTAQDGVIVGSPLNDGDSVLLPADD